MFFAQLTDSRCGLVSPFDGRKSKISTLRSTRQRCVEKTEIPDFNKNGSM